MTSPSVIRTITSKNTSAIELDPSNAYVGCDWMVDCNTVEQDYIARVAAINQGGLPSIVAITHHHPDHIGNLSELLDHGIIAYGPPTVVAVDQRVRLIQPSQTVPGTSLIAVATPGHTSDHLGFQLIEDGSKHFFCGDLLLGEGTPWIAPPDGDLKIYLDTLSAIVEQYDQQGFDLGQVYPGHGPRHATTVSVARHTLEHRLQREQQVADALADGLTNPEDIARHIYIDGEGQHMTPERFFLASWVVNAHIARLQASTSA